MQTISYIADNYGILGEKWIANIIHSINADMDVIKNKLRQSCDVKQLLEQLRSSVAQEYIVEYHVNSTSLTGLEYINGWRLHGIPVDMGCSPPTSKFKKRHTFHSIISLDHILNDKVAERIMSRIDCDYPAVEVITKTITQQIMTNMATFEEYMVIHSVVHGTDRLNVIFNDLVLSPLQLEYVFTQEELEYTNVARQTMTKRFKELTEHKSSLLAMIAGQYTVTSC